MDLHLYIKSLAGPYDHEDGNGAEGEKTWNFERQVLNFNKQFGAFDFKHNSSPQPTVDNPDLLDHQSNQMHS